MPTVWYHWVGDSPASTTTDTTWTSWTNAATSADSTLTTSTVWVNWVANDTITTSSSELVGPWVVWSGTVEETKAERRARLKREREWQAQAEQRRQEAEVRAAALRVEQEAAVARAEELLRAHLAEEQVAEYDRLKAFLVKAQSGKVYRIKKGWAGNVELLDDDGNPIMRMCIHPREMVPEQDNMLAQKLLLETDEASFNRIANKTPLRRELVLAP